MGKKRSINTNVIIVNVLWNIPENHYACRSMYLLSFCLTVTAGQAPASRDCTQGTCTGSGIIQRWQQRPPRSPQLQTHRDLSACPHASSRLKHPHPAHTCSYCPVVPVRDSLSFFYSLPFNTCIPKICIAPFCLFLYIIPKWNLSVCDSVTCFFGYTSFLLLSCDNMCTWCLCFHWCMVVRFTNHTV